MILIETNFLFYLKSLETLRLTLRIVGAKTVTIKKAAAIIEEVKTAVGNWADYAAQTKVDQELLQGMAKELEGV